MNLLFINHFLKENDMLNAKSSKSLVWIASLTAIAFAASFWVAVQSVAHTDALTTSTASQSADQNKITGEDDTEFLFIDKCKGGEAYRLKAYKITVNGEAIQMYDYQGPRGKGTIQSDVEPRHAKALLCNEDRSSWASSGRQSYN
jgi:cell division protein FtsB